MSKWISATYYSDFTERYCHDNLSECFKYIKEIFTNRKLIEKERYIYVYCREEKEEGADTSLLIICDNTEHLSTPIVTSRIVFDHNKPDGDCFPPLNYKEHINKINIAQKHALELEANEPDDNDDE